MSGADRRDPKPGAFTADLLGRIANVDEARKRHLDFLRNFPGIIYQAGIEDWMPTLFIGAVEDLTGYTQQDLTCGGVKWDSLIHRDDLSSFFSEGERRLHDTPGCSLTREYRIVRRDGSVRWVRDSVRNAPDGSGKLTVLEGVLFDVTELKTAQLALAENESRYRGLVDSLIEGLSIIDPDENIVFANRAFARILGFETAEEILGRNLKDFSSAEQMAAYEEQTGKRREEGASNSYEAVIVRPTGEKRQVVVYASPVHGPSGDFRGTQGLIVDITENRIAAEEKARLEAQVRHAQKLESLGVLAGGIAHDFNNILLTILGNAELAAGECGTSSAVKPRLDAIISATRTAADLCRQMLAYSGKGRVEVREIDLSALVEEMGHMLHVSISKKSAVVYDLELGLPKMEGDTGQVSQIVMNLITNASEAMEGRPGTIRVRTGVLDCDAAFLENCYPPAFSGQGEFVFLEVRDDGVGITPEAMERIFDPFFSTKFAGRGLGLSAVLGIVRGHGGAIRVESRPGEGAVFTAIFPALKEPACERKAEAPRPSGEKEWKGQGLVLFADDEFMIREVGEGILEVMGFEAVTASDGAKACEIFRERAADIVLVVLDLTMPEMDGREACAEILKIRPDAKVLMASGYSDPAIERELMELGAVGFLQKPFRMADFRESIRKALAGGVS